MVGASCAAGTHRPLRAAGGTHALEHLLRLTTWACAARCCGLQAGQQPRQHGCLGQQGPQKQRALAIGDEQCGEGFHIQITRDVRFVLDVHPFKAHVRVRTGQFVEQGAVDAAGAAPRGTQAHGPPVTARRAFGAQVAVARDTFDMTLIDTPAAEVGADAQLVAATCGSAIVVARRHASAHPRLARLGASLRDAGVTVIGGVLLDF